MGADPRVVKQNPLNGLHLPSEMLQWVGGQSQNLETHVARRAGIGREIRGGGVVVASTTGAPGSDSSSAWEKWGPQGRGHKEGRDHHAGVPCDSWLLAFVLSSTPRCPFLLSLL